MSQSTTWKEQLKGQLPPELEEDIEVYQTQMELKR